MAKDLFGPAPKKETNVVPFPAPVGDTLPVGDPLPVFNSKQEAIDWLNRDHFRTYLNGKFKVVRENPDGSLEIMEVKSFVDGNKEMQLWTTDEKGNQKLTPITEMWLKARSARNFKYGFEFDPTFLGNKNGKYNLWKGYRIQPKEGDVTPFREFTKDTICCGNEEYFKFLEAILFDMFQNPGKKKGVAVVIRGDEGVGKSFFVERLCDLIAPYYFKTSNPEHVFGDHNGQLKNVLLLHLEEAVWPGGKKTESLLKDLITGPTIPINDKFVPVYSVANHLHLFITGNPIWLVAASFQARRLFALHASEAHIQDTEYFAKLDHWFKNGGAEALMHYYLNGKSDINLRRIPVTDELLVQKEQSMSPVQEWWTSILETKEMPYGDLLPDGKVRVIKKLLYLDYIHSPVGKRYPISVVKFADQFLALLPTVVNGVEERNEKGRGTRTIVLTENIKIRDNRDIRRDGYEIPACEACRILLEFKLGGKKKWNSEVGTWTVLRANTDFDFSLYKPAWPE